MKKQNTHIITETLKGRKLLPWVTEYSVNSAKFKKDVSNIHNKLHIILLNTRLYNTSKIKESALKHQPIKRR